jgi:hypothetical protein
MAAGLGRCKGVLVPWARKKEADGSLFAMVCWMPEIQTPDLKTPGLSPGFGAGLGEALGLFPSGCHAVGF